MKLSFPFFNSLFCQHLKTSVLVLVKKHLVFLSVGKERISTVKLLNFGGSVKRNSCSVALNFFGTRHGINVNTFFFFFFPTENFPDGYLNPQIICPSCKSVL